MALACAGLIAVETQTNIVGQTLERAVLSVGAVECAKASTASVETVSNLFPLESSELTELPEPESLGLHFFSERDTDEVKLLADDALQAKSHFPVEEYIATAQRLNDEVGIELRIANQTDVINGVSVYDLDSPVDQRAIKQAIASELKGITGQPKEYIRYLGATQVYIADLDDPTVAGTYYLGGGVVYLDAISEPSDVIHESYHHWDMAACKQGTFMAKDTTYSALNKKNTYIGIDAFRKNSACGAAKVKNSNGKCQDSSLIGTELINDYASVDEPEDKASLIQYLSRGNTYTYVFGKDTVLRKKGIELLGRMYDDEPKLVQYMAWQYSVERSMQSQRPDTTVQ